MNYNTGDADYYHNGMVWPFVQGYWAWATAKSGSLLRFEFELNRILALSEKTDTFHEFYRPEDGTPDGSRRQLWSASGYLAMVYHGLFGMSFDTNGVEFTPIVPAQFSHLTLSGLRYRGMTLNVSVIGSGTEVATFALDGTARADKLVPSSLTGTHAVEIKMANTATNLALGKAATGSEPCAATESATLAVDGNVFNNSKWCSAASSKWLAVDLGATHDITKIALVHAGAVGEDVLYNTKDFDIMVSADNVTWTQAASVRGNKASTTAHPIVAQAARYIRLDVITPAQNSNGAARIYELEVY